MREGRHAGRAAGGGVMTRVPLLLAAGSPARHCCSREELDVCLVVLVGRLHRRELVLRSVQRGQRLEARPRPQQPRAPGQQPQHERRRTARTASAPGGAPCRPASRPSPAGDQLRLTSKLMTIAPRAPACCAFHTLSAKRHGLAVGPRSSSMIQFSAGSAERSTGGAAFCSAQAQGRRLIREVESVGRSVGRWLGRARAAEAGGQPEQQQPGLAGSRA